MKLVLENNAFLLTPENGADHYWLEQFKKYAWSDCVNLTYGTRFYPGHMEAQLNLEKSFRNKIKDLILSWILANSITDHSKGVTIINTKKLKELESENDA